jgi:hypothetical protein
MKYRVRVTLDYTVEIDAKNAVEAEQLACDDFIDEKGWDATIASVVATPATPTAPKGS